MIKIIRFIKQKRFKKTTNGNTLCTAVSFSCIFAFHSSKVTGWEPPQKKKKQKHTLQFQRKCDPCINSIAVTCILTACIPSSVDSGPASMPANCRKMVACPRPSPNIGVEHRRPQAEHRGPKNRNKTAIRTGSSGIFCTPRDRLN